MSLTKICFESLPSLQRSSLEMTRARKKWCSKDEYDVEIYRYIYDEKKEWRAKRERVRDEPKKMQGHCQIGLHNPVQPWKGTKEHPNRGGKPIGQTQLIPNKMTKRWKRKGYSWLRAQKGQQSIHKLLQANTAGKKKKKKRERGGKKPRRTSLTNIHSLSMTVCLLHW